jgi:hypothetical protein
LLRARRQGRQRAPIDRASASGKSSAIRPGPASLPVSPCSQRRRSPPRSPACPAPAGPRRTRQHVARARRGEPGRRILGDRDAALRRGHHRIGALQQHDRAGGYAAALARRILMYFSCLWHCLNNRANSPSCGSAPSARRPAL